MPRIYVACLASYNSGILHGDWIDLDGLAADDIQQEINTILRSSPCPNTTCGCPECEFVGHVVTVKKETRETHQDLGGVRVRVIRKVAQPVAGSCYNPAGEVFPDQYLCIVDNSNEVWPKDVMGRRIVCTEGQKLYFRRDELLTDCEHCKGTGQVPTAEEWAVHDYDDIPSSFGEHPSLESLVKYCEAYEEHGEPFKVWWENESDTDFDVERFQEQYQGTYRNLEDYAEDFMEQTGGLDEVPQNLRYYTDYESMARDWELSGDIWTAPGGDGIYVFNNH